MLSTIFKQGKTNYYNHYFEANWNSIKNTWKGIKSLKRISVRYSGDAYSFQCGMQSLIWGG